MTACAKAIEILQHTHDGDDLAPQHLKLVELAVNGFLNETGVAAFDDLHARVASNTYAKPWLHGVENLTISHEGYVRWKGQIVEHFTYYDAQSHERLAEQARAVGEVCAVLEHHGVPVTTRTVLDALAERREQAQEEARAQP